MLTPRTDRKTGDWWPNSSFWNAVGDNETFEAESQWLKSGFVLFCFVFFFQELLYTASVNILKTSCKIYKLCEWVVTLASIQAVGLSGKWMKASTNDSGSSDPAGTTAECICGPLHLMGSRNSLLFLSGCPGLWPEVYWIWAPACERATVLYCADVQEWLKNHHPPL